MRVSIGLPFVNNADTLTAAIRSIFAQTCEDWELLLVDDGATDASLKIARAVRDRRVTVYSDGHRRGLSFRLNQIACLARGEYLARMDADDMMHPDRLTTQVDFLEAHRDVDVVDTAMYSIDHDGRLAGARGHGKLIATPEVAIQGALLQHPTILGRTQWFRNNPYDVALPRAEDYELWCRTVGRSTFERVPCPLYYYREGSGNLARYLASGRCVRTVLRQLGPKQVGHWRTRKLLAFSWFKGALYLLLAGLRADHLLVGLRNDRLEPAAKATAHAGLRLIANTPIPGFEPSAIIAPVSKTPRPLKACA